MTAIVMLPGLRDFSVQISCSHKIIRVFSLSASARSYGAEVLDCLPHRYFLCEAIAEPSEFPIKVSFPYC
jgi:hypothetical protein